MNRVRAISGIILAIMLVILTTALNVEHTFMMVGGGEFHWHYLFPVGGFVLVSFALGSIVQDMMDGKH